VEAGDVAAGGPRNIHRVGNLRYLGEKRRSAMFEFLGTGLFVTWLANGIKWYNRLANGI
jgi:hypothetical protein